MVVMKSSIGITWRWYDAIEAGELRSPPEFTLREGGWAGMTRSGDDQY